MGQLTPIKLEDGTEIYIETTDQVNGTIGVNIPSNARGDNTPRSLLSNEAQKQVAQSYEMMENTIRSYTSSILKAVKDVASAEVNEVTLKFGVNVSGVTGVPYIASGSAGCNVEITVKCVFPHQ